jgi:hypothetical protein
VVQEHGIAIGLRVLGAACSNGAAGTSNVLDHDRLAKGLGHRRTERTGDGVGGATGRKRHEHGDRFGRVLLSNGSRGAECQAHRKAQRSHHPGRELHRLSPCMFRLIKQHAL